eukprot:s1428_g10.t1
MLGAPRRFRPRRGGAGRGGHHQADPAATDEHFTDWNDVANGAEDPEEGEHQNGGNASSSYFGTNDAAGAPTEPTPGDHQAGGCATAMNAGAASFVPPGFGDPTASSMNMSPIQPVWFGPPASNWSALPSGGRPGLPHRSGLPQQALDGTGMAGCAMPPYMPCTPMGFPGHGHPMMGMTMMGVRPPLHPGVSQQAPMSSAYNVLGPCANLPHSPPGVCPQSPQPHQVPSAVFQQAPNGLAGCAAQFNSPGSGGNSPQAMVNNSPVRPERGQPGPSAMPDPWSNYQPTETVANAREFSQKLREERPNFKPVTSAFEAMGKTTLPLRQPLVPT